MPNRSLRDRIAIPNIFRNHRVLTAIGAAMLVACGLSPREASAALIPSQDGNTVYDTVNNVTWLADMNLPASNRFGLPICSGSGTQTCLNASGSMRYSSAAAWVTAMNAAKYLGHTNWQLPTTPPNDSGCGKSGPNGNNFGFGCAASAFGLLWNTLGLKAPNTAVPIPSNTVGPFSNFQPYLYWSQSGAPPPAGNYTFSFATGWQGANTLPNLLYALPMIPGKLPGTPATTGNGLQVNPGGQTVYDPVTNITWLANANLAASNTFGLPACADPTTPALCVAPDGAMTFASATQFIGNMNTFGGTGYLGHSNWQLPTIDSGCPGYNCTGAQNPMGNLFYTQLGFGPGMTVVTAPNIAVRPFHNMQPYLYWTCGAATIQAACDANGPAPNFEWSFSLGSGFEGTDLLANDLYATPYFVGPPANVCTYSLSSGGQAFAATGGSGAITITTEQGCPWIISGAPIWVTNPTSGSGNGTLTFQVVANAGADRTSTIAVEGISYTIEQEAAAISGLALSGSMAHLAAEEDWTTAFTLVNKTAANATARLSFFGDAIDPSGNAPLSLPLAFPQQTNASGPLVAASFDRTLAANASLILISAGAQTSPVLVGSAQLAATGAVDGFAIFHQIFTTQEAVVPLETRNANSYLLAFDNTIGLVLGVAVENLSAANAAIPVIIRDDTGVVISSPGATISLGGNGHTSFVLSDTALGFPVTADKRGTIEFDTPAGGRISVLGLRFSPPNNALTTIPALANVGTGGGSIAHIASEGDGWQTTFVLINTGASATQATLSFFNDQTGLALPLPLTFPQPGGGADTMASSVTKTLAAGATLVIVSGEAPQLPTGSAPLLTGSAQLTTAGHVSGFVIFRHNDQEAVVPLESRNASGYVIAFDNTRGTATGIAVNAVSTGQSIIPVTVRDSTGATIATDNITLSANGHYAFTLVTGRYPVTADIRGTIEFDAPVGAQIGALGIRIPAGDAHTYTTLPALAK